MRRLLGIGYVEEDATHDWILDKEIWEIGNLDEKGIRGRILRQGNYWGADIYRRKYSGSYISTRKVLGIGS